MSFFKKMMASVGVGSAKVDTVLNAMITRPGGKIAGTVHVKGGSVEQDIEDIDVSLMVDVKREANDKTYYEPMYIAKHRVTGRFKIMPNEHKQFPFEFQVPLEVPITVLGPYKLGNIKLYVKTDLDIDNALDKADRDLIEVEPLPNMVNFLNAVISLGFGFQKADVEYGRIPGSSYNFFEEIEFVGHRSQFPRIRELEVTFIAKPEGVLAVLEMDKRGFFGSSDKYRTIMIPYDDSRHNHVAHLQQVLSQV
ncbi:MAG: sporulation protein [Bacteroidota bacterium]|jgi:sporulation-control protein